MEGMVGMYEGEEGIKGREGREGERNRGKKGRVWYEISIRINSFVFVRRKSPAILQTRLPYLFPSFVLSPLVILQDRGHDIENAPSKAAVFRVDEPMQKLDAAHLQKVTAKIDVVAPI